MTTTLRIETPQQHVRLIELNRPEAHNAFNVEMAQAFAEEVANAEADPDARVILLSAAGDTSFSAGADLKVLARGEAAKLSTKTGGFAGFIRAPRTKPWIAVVEGRALGGGLELCLACDMIVAGQNASFGLPEVRRGVFAGAGGVFRLPRVIPRALAFEMIATGEPISAQRAYDAGLVNRLSAAGDAKTEALRLAERIVLSAPIAVQRSLAIARSAADETEEELWARSRTLGKDIAETEDFQEGLRAFAEKRTPTWTGRLRKS
ncbi:MAG: enoyl-CoA hydratase-related protein [Hyphomonadaceae bacterium]